MSNKKIFSTLSVLAIGSIAGASIALAPVAYADNKAAAPAGTPGAEKSCSAEKAKTPHPGKTCSGTKGCNGEKAKAHAENSCSGTKGCKGDKGATEGAHSDAPAVDAPAAATK